MRARSLLAVLLVSAVVAGIPITGWAATGVHRAPVVRHDDLSPSSDQPGWQRRIDALIGDRPMSVTIGDDGAFWYRHLAWVKRAPASNEKLLLSMALLAAVGPDRVIETRAMAAAAPVEGVIDGDLWLVGHGDPELAPDALNALAQQIGAAGVTRIEGSVFGDTGPFERDWWAPGWKEEFPAEEVAIPTALTFRGNVGPEGRHIDDPELRAAAYLTKALRRRGIRVKGPAGVGSPDGPRVKIATIDSAPIVDILRRMDVDSVNFDAEVLGKVLGAEVSGTASIAAGAAAIDAFTAANGARDSSTATRRGSRTRTASPPRAWCDCSGRPTASRGHPTSGRPFPIGGQGTLEGRLGHTRIRAKTGTLTDISALSGWVWSRRTKDWVEFSILSDGLEQGRGHPHRGRDRPADEPTGESPVT